MTHEEILAELTGEKRLEQAFMLTELVCELSLKNIKQLAGKKKLTRYEMLQKLRERIELQY